MPFINPYLAFDGRYATFTTGPWGRIFYGKFDGRRKKRVLVKIIGE
jgi:thiamine phosphate synthase YjbQ (UPF0047 family)